MRFANGGRSKREESAELSLNSKIDSSKGGKVVVIKVWLRHPLAAEVGCDCIVTVSISGVDSIIPNTEVTTEGGGSAGGLSEECW